jgi:ribosomal protein S6--L-glutamate ligase
VERGRDNAWHQNESPVNGTIGVAFLLTRHQSQRLSPIMPDVVRRLGDRGARVETIYPEEMLTDLGSLDVAHDLYVLKSKTDTTLSLAGALHAAGAAILNPYPVSTACRDKIVLSAVLRAAGVPQPETWVATDPTQLGPLLDAGPIVVKPYRGSQGRGVHLVRTPDDVASAGDGERPFFVQRYHQPHGRDRKLYRIGAQVFGVTFEVGAALREIVLRCGAAFGIDLYGLDVLEADDGPYVVDFSSFPGFKGVPDADRLLADYIWEAAVRAAAGAGGMTARREAAAAP